VVKPRRVDIELTKETFKKIAKYTRRQLLEIVARTCVVIVTYNNRSHLVKQVVDAAFENGVGKVIIVDNGSTPASRHALQEMEARLPEKLVIIRLPENKGSSGGYKAGLEYVMNCQDCDYVWLLDDDNRPEKGALETLCQHYIALSEGEKREDLALLSLREDRNYLARIAMGESSRRVFPRRSSFLSFHVLDLSRKVIKRLCCGSIQRQKVEKSKYQMPVQIPYGPYGGLFFHRNVLRKLGYPNERFFVYADDIEFTWRFTKRGGRLFLVPESIIRDIDQTWFMKAKGGTSFSRYLLADSTAQVYYTIRNSVYFCKREWVDNHLIYLINKWFYLGALWVWSQLLRKTSRFSLILETVRYGEQGKFAKYKEDRTL